MNKIYLYLLIVVGITLGGCIGLLKVENGDLKTDIQRLNRELVIEKAQGAIYFTKEMFSHTYLFTDEVGHNFFK